MTFQSEDDVHEAVSGGSIHQTPAEINYVAGQLIYHEDGFCSSEFDVLYRKALGFLKK